VENGRVWEKIQEGVEEALKASGDDLSTKKLSSIPFFVLDSLQK
jgi:hypothetical protein